jgi:sulfhydrogenase subunit beta (sulfur reductase)
MTLYINRDNIGTFVAALSGAHNVFYTGSDLSFQKYSGQKHEKIDLDLIRPLTPIKSFFFVDYEKLVPAAKSRPNIVLGVKACDLKALGILDKMFLEGVISDPFYEARRKNTIIVSSDCPEPGEHCFCTFVENKPYVESGFDINFASIGEGYIVDVKSDRGEDILKKNRALFGNLSEKVFSLCKKQRENSVKKMQSINKDFGALAGINYQKLMKEKFSDTEQWKLSSEKCVQCLGCNIICPSCYCFLVSEERADRTRYRFWDACHSTSYGRVAGGANSRPRLHERFRNRYQCKFNYRKTNFNEYACTGCGRCIDVCPGNIDLRKVNNALAGA